MKLKVFTVNDVRQLRPCYDPVTGLDEDGNMVHPGGFVPENWVGTALDVLRLEACPAEDRLWVVCHEGWIDDKTLRLFAVWCARQALQLVDDPDPRVTAACDVAERFATGRATSQELSAARAAAMDAAWNIAKDTVDGAVRQAAWATVWATAEDAAWSAAQDTADAAARAADGAARIAAWSAADTAARDTDWSVWADAWTAARKVQIEHLIAMLESED